MHVEQKRRPGLPFNQDAPLQRCDGWVTQKRECPPSTLRLPLATPCCPNGCAAATRQPEGPSAAAALLRPALAPAPAAGRAPPPGSAAPSSTAAPGAPLMPRTPSPDTAVLFSEQTSPLWSAAPCAAAPDARLIACALSPAAAASSPSAAAAVPAPLPSPPPASPLAAPAAPASDSDCIGAASSPAHAALRSRCFRRSCSTALLACAAHGAWRLHVVDAAQYKQPHLHYDLAAPFSTALLGCAQVTSSCCHLQRQGAT